MKEVFARLAVGIALCVLAPYAVMLMIIEHLELSWFHIFMVSGLESLWVYLCFDISRWIKQAWTERDKKRYISRKDREDV